MKITTILQAKELKAELERNIAAELRQFTEDTGITVTQVDIDPVIRLCEPAGYRGYRVEVEARL